MDSNTQQKRDELVARLRKANDIASANAVLSWDQSTYMPPAGASAPRPPDGNTRRAGT